MDENRKPEEEKEQTFPVTEVHEEAPKHEPLTHEQAQEVAPLYSEIGRASCRERV